MDIRGGDAEDRGVEDGGVEGEMKGSDVGAVDAEEAYELALAGPAVGRGEGEEGTARDGDVG